MPRAPREDKPGTWHHVVNRAIARRTLLERREDFRFFMAQLARSVHRGEVEVHAFSLMGTHYHLLLRSPDGDLGKPMQRIQLAYSRWFNRSRKRDGSLVRGRNFSKRVDSDAYAHMLVRYIDCNPVKAGIVGSAAMYPYGSAFHYARASGPPWLERSWIEEVVRDSTGSSTYRPAEYARNFGAVPDDLIEVIEARVSHKAKDDPLDNLVTASPDQVREWMVRKARLADGTNPNLPTLSLKRLVATIAAQGGDAWTVRSGQMQRDAWPVVVAGLGKDLCGATLARLAEQLEVSHSTTSKLRRIHIREMRRGGAYAARVATLVSRAMEVWGA